MNKLFLPQLLAGIVLLGLLCSACRKPEFGINTREKEPTAYSDESVAESLNMFSKINLAMFAKDFKADVSRQTGKGRSKFMAFVTTYVGIHVGNVDTSPGYSATLTGLFFWILAIFVIVLLVRIIGMARYSKTHRP